MMLYRLLAIMIVVLGTMAVSGCVKKGEPVEPSEAAQQVQEEATPITEENLDAELEKMEKQIEADIAAEE